MNMNIIGIAAEYNPFHYGHEHHIKATRAAVGENSAIVCAMSGDFVQRGEAAAYAKFARAEAACRAGADLVLELPLPWALSSAEGFARGAVGILAAAGAQYISFGSEAGDIAALEKLAALLSSGDIIEKTKLLLRHDPDLSFAAARQRAVESEAGELAGLLEKPNNILAVEYIKAIYAMDLNIKPVTAARLGSGHDELSGTGFKSAAELRRLFAAGEDVSAFMPSCAFDVYAGERAKGRVPELSRMELAVMSRLRALSESDFISLPDGSNGAGERLYAAVRKGTSLDNILLAAKTKRFALARLRRMCMCAALGVREGMAASVPPYLRVLAANEKGRAVLRDAAARTALPIVTKPAAVKKISPECADLFALGASAHDLYTLSFCSERERKAGEDWRTGPKIV